MRILLVLALLTGCRDKRVDVAAAHIADLQRRIGALETQMAELRAMMQGPRPSAGSGQ